MFGKGNHPDDLGGNPLVTQEYRKRPRNRKELILALERKNKYRIWRLRQDARWARRQIKKMGLDPNLVRELL